MKMHPNILFITTDQQRSDTIGCYGNHQIQTPHLDTLASESFVFENAYCTTAVCTPSRASYLTGQWPHKHQCIANNTPLAPNVQTIAELISRDYRRAYYGKWHLGDEIIAQHGFEERISTEDGPYRPYYSRTEYLQRRSDYHQFLIKNGFVPDAIASDGAPVFSRKFAAALSEQYTKPSFLAQEATRFIHEQPHDRPFLLGVSFLEPHPPFWSALNDHHDPAALEISPTFAQIPVGPAPIRVRMMGQDFKTNGVGGFSLQSEANWRRVKANYYGLVSLVDRAAGQILQALEDSGQTNHTLVVFTSDHGEMMGNHGLFYKGLRYEESIKIPLIMRIPWLSQSQIRIPGNISLVDLVPTLLELMEQPPGNAVQGQSRANVLRGEADLSENNVVVAWYGDGDATYWESMPDLSLEEIYTAAFGQWRTIITPDRWKLSMGHNDRCELYDLNADPNETVNLFDDPGQQQHIRELAFRLKEWQHKTGDTLELPEV
jgi:arylsulfatase